MNPNYLAYCRVNNHDTVEQQKAIDAELFPGGTMGGFMLWMAERKQEFSTLTGWKPDHVVFDVDGFHAWLQTLEPAFTVNTLVLVKDKPDWGLCCIAKEYKKQCLLNVGIDSTETVAKKRLSLLPDCYFSSVKWGDVRRMSFANSKDLPRQLIFGNTVREWVGIGWIERKVATFEDLRRLKRVVQ